MEMKFYKCRICGKIMAMIDDSGMDTICCGEKMERLVPGLLDASKEKHVPIIDTNGDLVIVTVGKEMHPKTEEHHIEWIAIETKMGNQRKLIKPGNDPRVCFKLCEGDKVLNAYAYCNIHELWKG